MAGDRRRFVLFGAVLAAAALTVVACSGEEAADTSGTTVPATQPTLPTTSTAPIEDRLDIEVVQTGVTQMPATGACRTPPPTPWSSATPTRPGRRRRCC
ncbi:MAG: hypothetical protein R2690_13565 [Acidimicrobiales bacterium]